jgi:hypothetical protein
MRGKEKEGRGGAVVGRGRRLGAGRGEATDRWI